VSPGDPDEVDQRRDGHLEVLAEPDLHRVTARVVMTMRSGGGVRGKPMREPPERAVDASERWPLPIHGLELVIAARSTR
jgi:hypothetical protein